MPHQKDSVVSSLRDLRSYDFIPKSRCREPQISKSSNMLRPIALSIYPSCRDAISWSADGELAIAAGEYFHVLTPRSGKDQDPAPNSDPDWAITRVRANLFTNAEWPSFLPGNRDEFSIAGEQSNANIIGLSWSPLGLGKYRRSVLTVLTSNLVLSLWEPLGLKKQWTRVGIVNHAFWAKPEHSQDPNDHGFRKSNIRSFTWCDSFKASASTDPSALPAHESRWGASLLVVVNDLNEISIIRVDRSNPIDASSKRYGLRVLATHILENQETNNNLVCAGSLFARAWKEQQRTTSLSCGPWLSSPREISGDSDCAVAVVAAVCGTQLRLIKLEAIFENSIQNKLQQCKLSAMLEKHPLELSNERWASHNITGPIGWLHTSSPKTISLTVGIMAGFISITMSDATYSTSADADAPRFREWPIYEPENEDKPYHKERHLEPICTLLPTKDEHSDTCKLHLGTLGGVGLTAQLSQIQNDNALQQPQWKRMVEDFQEQFDLDHDLGGMVVSRIWGLASCRNITAAIFANHPTDMVEYRVSSDDRTTIVFSEEFGRIADSRAVFTPRTLSGQVLGHDQVGEVIRSVLPGADGDVESDEESQRLIYVVACRAIVGEKDKSLRAHAQRSLERLAVVTGADLTEEISKCNSGPSLLAAKSMDHLNGPGGHVFEKCEVCDAGMGWCSTHQARCANGHIWLRCGVSFLAIQEPGISKYCSFCRTEALDEECVASSRGRKLSQTVSGLFGTFDTCLYCAGKFQPTY